MKISELPHLKNPNTKDNYDEGLVETLNIIIDKINEIINLLKGK